MIFSSGWFTCSPFLLYPLLLLRYFYDIQWIIHILYVIEYFPYLFITGGITKLELMLSWFLHLYLNMFPLILYHPVPVIHGIFRPGCLPYCCSWLNPPCGLVLVVHSCSFSWCVWGSLGIHGSRISLPCHRGVFFKHFLLFLDNVCPVVFLLPSVAWPPHPFI